MLITLLMSILLVPMPPDNPLPADLNHCEQTMLEDLNSQRARHGAAPLVIDPALQRGARDHTIWMGRHRKMKHASGHFGENIAMGQGDTSQVMRSWMNSSGHRSNMLSRNYTRVGVSGYRIGGTFWWTQRFR